MSRRKNYLITVNNPSGDETVFWADLLQRGLDTIQYLVLQEERGESGTPHYQIYIEMKVQKRLTWMKNTFGNRIHLEGRRGSQNQAIAYCTKEDTRVIGGLAGSWGTPRVRYVLAYPIDFVSALRLLLGSSLRP